MLLHLAGQLLCRLQGVIPLACRLFQLLPEGSGLLCGLLHLSLQVTLPLLQGRLCLLQPPKPALQLCIALCQPALGSPCR